jgi:DnaJ family protein C protein 3
MYGLYLSDSARSCSRLDVSPCHTYALRNTNRDSVDCRTYPILPLPLLWAYFLLPPSQLLSYLSPFKQCLHLDPDSSSCLPAHRLAESLDKVFSKLTKLMEADDWKGVLKHIVGSAKDFPGDGFARTFEASLLENGTPDMLAPSSSKLPLPNVLSTSPRRAFILHAACRAYLKLNIPKKGEPWCDELIAMHEDTLRALSDMGGDTNPEVDA